MTDDEAVVAFLENQNTVEGDAEVEHMNGDHFITKFLESHGYPKLAAAYSEAKTSWWYA